MSKKILLSILVIVVAIGLVGVGTYALWSDTATSAGNVFASGTFDLSLENSAALPVVAYPMYPGARADYKFDLKNASNVDVPAELVMDGTWTGDAGLKEHLTADVYFDGVLKLDDVALTDGEMVLGDLAKGATKTVEIQITMSDAVSGTDHMEAAISGAVTFTLNQH
ncbi:MAG: TasA family protein [Actinomycetota bacterium]|nr:TasA family protein [Actinomycetota bacterium]